MLKLLIRVAVLWIAGLWIAGPLVAQGIDLAERYPSTLDFSQSGLGWTIDVEDVYELKSFDIQQGSGFSVRGKRATLVLGRSDTNILWGAIYPDKPVEISSPLAGGGEHADEIFVRMAPSEIAELFPPKTVVGPGEAAKRTRATRLFAGKIGWRWSTPSGNTTVVPKGIVVVDYDSLEGTRRLFALSRTKGQVSYIDEFEGQLLEPLVPVNAKEAKLAFDYVWECFDREYAKFARFPDLNWKKHKKLFRKRAKATRTTLDLGSVIADMLRVLEDLHVYVSVGSTYLPGYTRARPLNASFEGSNKTIGGVEKSGPNLWVAQTTDGIGYLNIHGLNDTELPALVDAALEQLADSWALVIDVRFNGGGDESLAQRIAGRFVERATVYSQNQYRSGKKHDKLGPVLDRVVKPRPDVWRYSAPVIALQGRVTFSSAESFVEMLEAAPNVTTLGDFTGGSSANPRRIELDCGITVNLPRWVDMDAVGNPMEGIGFAPDERLSFSLAEFTEQHDPLLAAALSRLREQPEQMRSAGKRL